MNSFSRFIAFSKKIYFSVPRYFWAALLIRFLFMTFGAHQDALFIPWFSNWIADGNWDIYDFFKTLRDSQNVLMDTIWIPNPPVPYFLLAIWMFFIKSLKVLDVSGWTYTGFDVWNLELVPRTLFLVKGLYLVLDILIWKMLRGFVDRKLVYVIDLAWLFSPILLIPTYVMGQTDIISVFWVVLALFFIKRFEQKNQSKWYYFALISLGLGAASKLWPLFLAPSLCILMFSKVSKKPAILGILAGLAAFLIPVLPFYSDVAFREWVIFGHGTGFLGSLPAIWIQTHIWFIVFWTVVHIILFFIQKEWEFQDLWVIWLLILIGFFVINPFWEFYWFLWILPFIVLAIATNLNVWLLYLGILAYYFFYMIIGWDFGLEIFMQGISGMSTPGPRPRNVFFGTFEPMVKVMSISYSVFVGILLGIGIIVILSAWYVGNVQLRKKEIFSFEQSLEISGIWGLYFLFLFWVGLKMGNVPFGRFISGYSATVAKDPYFFIVLVCSLIVLLILWITPRKLKEN